MTYVKQEQDDFEYFIYKEAVYLFPEFNFIFAADDDGTVLAVNRDDEEISLDKYYVEQLARLDPPSAHPVKLLVSKQMAEWLTHDTPIPEYLFFVTSYEDAFINEDPSQGLWIPQSTSDLYHSMLQNGTLCGAFSLDEDGKVITWDLYESVFIRIYADENDWYVGAFEKCSEEKEREIAHWHPTPMQIYDTVLDIGKRGNVLVLKHSRASGAFLYAGSKEACRYSPTPKSLFGKYYYLEAKTKESTTHND